MCICMCGGGGEHENRVSCSSCWTEECMKLCLCRCDPVHPSLSVNQSPGSLAETEPFGPEVLGVTCWKERISVTSCRYHCSKDASSQG